MEFDLTVNDHEENLTLRAEPEVFIWSSPDGFYYAPSSPLYTGNKISGEWDQRGEWALKTPVNQAERDLTFRIAVDGGDKPKSTD